MILRNLLAAAAVALLLAAPGRAAAQSADMVQTTVYFGLRTADGNGVSEQQWGRFLAETVTPRFPDGLTVLKAYGQSRGSVADSVSAQTTKMLVIVHRATAEAAAALAEIKSEYRARFAGAGLFHTEAPVRIVE